VYDTLQMLNVLLATITKSTSSKQQSDRNKKKIVSITRCNHNCRIRVEKVLVTKVWEGFFCLVVGLDVLSLVLLDNVSVVSMCVCVYVCVCVCMCVYVCICVLVYVLRCFLDKQQTYEHTHIHMHIHVHTYTHTHTPHTRK